jgi:hypothetical protein
MPAPKRVLSALACDVDSDPVWRAWLSGSAYSFAAGDPGSTCTPGSSACAPAAAQLVASAPSAANTTQVLPRPPLTMGVKIEA